MKYRTISSISLQLLAKGVTKIPGNLSDLNDQGFEPFETVVFSKSVTVIGSEAFHWCPNLRSVREIRNDAFDGCKSLQSLIISDSVTTVCYCCGYLESVLFYFLINHVFRRLDFNPLSFPSRSFTQEDMHLQIAQNLSQCYLHIHPSKQSALVHSAVYHYNELTSQHQSQQIECGAFSWGPVLQIIDIPRQAVVNPSVFFRALATSIF